MDKFWEAYGAWPPLMQVLLAFAAVLVPAVCLFLLAVLVRGWPGRPGGNGKIPSPPRAPRLDPLCGYDFREEARRTQEEQEYQANLQAKMLKNERAVPPPAGPADRRGEITSTE